MVAAAEWSMVRAALVLAAVLALFGSSISWSEPSVSRGEALYENHCATCHTCKAHTRRDPAVRNLDQLAREVDRWQAQQKLDWKGEDRSAVVEYLNQTYYKF
jgi:mono/diheme cytochrome c family protein